jgi:hypothetical protein
MACTCPPAQVGLGIRRPGSDSATVFFGQAAQDVLVALGVPQACSFRDATGAVSSHVPPLGGPFAAAAAQAAAGYLPTTVDHLCAPVPAGTAQW